MSNFHRYSKFPDTVVCCFGSCLFDGFHNGGNRDHSSKTKKEFVCFVSNIYKVRNSKLPYCHKIINE